MTIKSKAIYALYSNAVKTVEDKDLVLTAFDVDGNEITLNMTNINNWVDPNAYVDKRIAEYPNITEQLDLLYKDMISDKGDKNGAWFAAVKAVKDKYPKE
jgi:hypothetical protein